MHLPKLCVSVLALVIPFFTRAQPVKNDVDFVPIDNYARSVTYKSDIYRLTKELTDPYTEPIAKTRAIFIWITDNISYDYEFVNKEKQIEGPECKPGQDCRQIRIEWENDYLKNILKKKKGVCDAYARLFKKMCELAGIPCEIIGGYSKTKLHQIGIPLSANHAWNAVLIDSGYHLVDATWAAGYCVRDEESDKLLSFHKRYNEYYWFTPFHAFTRNHYPKNAKWVFEPNYTKEVFEANPWYAGEVLDKINLLSPASGIIHAKKGDTVHFTFTYTEPIRYIQTNTNVFRNPAIVQWRTVLRNQHVPEPDTLAMKKQQFIPFTRDGNKYTFDYVVTDNSLYYIDVLIDFRRVLRFKVKTGE
jgi:transglutaminase-like putative cysteine protease